MDTPRNRGSPRLQFTKEELEDSMLSEPINKAEKAADRYEAAQKKIKKHYRLKLSREEADAPRTAGEKTGSGSHEETMPGPEDGIPETDPFIRTDPKAPAVQNTRHKAKAPSGSTGKKAASSDSAVQHTENAGTDKPVSSAAPKKKGVRLKFEETQAQKPSRLSHPVQKTVRGAGDQLHRQAVKTVEANGDDNSAVEAVLQADRMQESVLQMGEHAHHTRSLRHYRQAEKAEKKLDRANIQFLEAKQKRGNPQFSSNPLSRWQQKRAIRREYAAAKAGRRTTMQNTAKGAGKAVEKTGGTVKKSTDVIRRHLKALPLLALGALLLMVMGLLQSCTPLVQSLLESVAVGTYPASEENVRAAERAYLEMEEALQDEMDNYLLYHPECSECSVEADSIWHDPYVLTAIISACFDGEEWDIESAMPVIERYFHLQYSVSVISTTETRFRNETVTGTRIVTDPETGRQYTETYTYEAEVPYTYTYCDVLLENRNLSHLPVETMSHHTLSLYALYMSTHGNMEGIFTGPYATPLRDPMLYDIPQETLDADPTFAALMEEANKYVGYPYVWGGSDPETSFDCSGFVCYVFTNSGICRTGRLGTKGLRELCRDVPDDQPQPGDIVFFEGTMGAGVEGVTHCGIYVGNNMMIHCGSPIGYADLNDSYWRTHFHSFGRVPN